MNAYVLISLKDLNKLLNKQKIISPKKKVELDCVGLPKIKKGMRSENTRVQRKKIVQYFYNQILVNKGNVLKSIADTGYSMQSIYRWSK